MNLYLYILLLIATSGVHYVRSMPSKISSRPPYIECFNSDDCSIGSCCVLGMGRYSIPTCQPKMPSNYNCRPASQMPINSTVAYPDGSIVELHNVHLLMCPCEEGSVCHPKEGVCTPWSESVDDNYL